jgi:general secretion pathway protein D
MGGLGKYYTIPKDFISGATSDLTVPGIAVLFSLDEFKGVLNVLSTPQLLTSDNKEAEIMVGSNIPIITQRKSDTSALAGTIINSVERRDIGIMLKLTPQITEGDVVKLELYQEISRLAENESQDIIINVGPTFDKRSTKTSVAVQDGQTIVISGLIENSETETIEKVPVLGDIPLLGLLFKYKTFKREKKNLLVFITPHIIKDAEKISKITSQKERNFAVSEKRFVEGELLVKFKEGVSRERVHEIISQQEATIIKVIDEIAVYHLKLRKGQQVEDATAGFSKMPEVAYAEPNYRMKVQ